MPLIGLHKAVCTSNHATAFRKSYRLNVLGKYIVTNGKSILQVPDTGTSQY